MSTNHTENYNLSQWSPSDSFLRAEFNENLQKIDAALKSVADRLPHVVTGLYLGQCAESDHTVQEIDLGFQPKAVLIMPCNGGVVASSGGRKYGGLMFPDCPIAANYDITKWAGQITPTGFQVRNDAGDFQNLNYTDKRYYYIALA